MDELRIRFSQNNMLDPDMFSLFIWRNTGNPSSPVTWLPDKPLELTACEPGELIMDPSPVGTFTSQQIQGMFDGLWQAGFRPSRGTEPTEAVQAHLADLRAILWHTIGMPYGLDPNKGDR